MVSEKRHKQKEIDDVGSLIEVNFWAVLVAALAAFVASTGWYILQLRINPGAMVDVKETPGWARLVELVRNLVLAYVLAHLLVLLKVADWLGAANLGVWLWIGFPVILLSGSVIWQRVPWKVAAIHAGDWLVKLLLMTVLLGIWR
jgi:hypothetical protein